MILKNNGDIYTYNDLKFVVGEPIYANENSDYQGSFGVITEICTGDDKETDNETPDIYCRLEPPVLPYDIESFEKHFSELYGTKKTLDDITLDLVILSPEMITTIESITKENSTLELFVVQEEVCSDGDSNTYTYLFTDYVRAKQKLNEIVAEDFRNGCISVWKDNKEFVYENDIDSFEGWIDNRYCESHYFAHLFKENICLSSDVFRQIGNAYINEYLRTCFKEQTEQWDSLDELGDDGYEKLLNSKELLHKIKEKLESDEAFLEKFWEAFSSVCFDIIREKECLIMKRNKTKGILKSGKIYSAQAYLELVLGEAYILDHQKPVLSQIERLLYLNRKPYGSFTLQETQKALNHKGSYVLVSCCDSTKDLVPYEEYRWFRVPDNIPEGAL